MLLTWNGGENVCACVCRAAGSIPEDLLLSLERTDWFVLWLLEDEELPADVKVFLLVLNKCV